MKHILSTASIISSLILLFLITTPLKTKAEDNTKRKTVTISFPGGASNYLVAFKKKIKTIDISFSVVIKGKYVSQNLETKEVSSEDRIETVMGGGETNNSTLERDGLPDKKLTCNGNSFTLSYTTKNTYLSSPGTYTLVGEVSADGKMIKSITVQFAGSTGPAEKWSYNVIANDIPWVGSLGPNFDKVKRNYGFKYPKEGKPFSHVEYVKQTDPSEVWRHILTAESVDSEKRQSFDIYFTFE